MTTAQASEEVPVDSFEMRLYIARWHAGRITAKKAAALVGVTDTTWRNWEAGIHTDSAKRPAMLHYIASQLAVDLDWLREGGPLKTSDAPGPEGPEGKSDDAVRQQGLEPRTRWFAGSKLKLVRAA